MAPLILATRNEHKLRELREALPGIELEPLPEDVVLPPETGETFAENALGKARAAHEATGRPAIADDSGIEAAALGGRPGVCSARYAGEGASDEENLAKLISELREADDAGLAYVCAIALVAEDGSESLFEGRCDRDARSRAARDGRLRLRPGLRPRRHRAGRRAHDGRARARREARDQPPRAGGPGAGARALGAAEGP